MPDDGPVSVTRVTRSLLRDWPLPSGEGDKEDKGRLLVVGGSASTPGAVVLAAEAALRVGAGKVQVATAASTAAQVAAAVPEALVVGLATTGGELSPAGADRILDLASGADAVLIGPGLGDPGAARELLAGVLPALACSVVVDALGTAYATGRLSSMAPLAGRALLTPNLTELAALLDEDETVVGRDVLGATRRVAAASGVTVVSGAAVTCVVEPSGRARTIEVGAPGSAVAGSGDVKAGAIAGLVARGADPARAGAWGAWLHARSGERLTASIGRVGYLAREICSQLPHAMTEVEPVTGPPTHIAPRG